MTNQQNSKRRSFPPYDESSKLSRRDQTLVRVDKLLSEQFIVPLQDEAQFEEDEPVDLVDLEEAVETAQLPPEERPQPRTFAPKPPAPVCQPQAPVPPVAAAPEKKSRLSVFSVALQAAILIFVLAWVFLLGILVGRGHLWQSGLGHDLVVWVEQKAGWSDKAGPEIVLKKDNQPDEIIPPQGQPENGSETDLESEEGPDGPLEAGSSDSGGAPAEEPDEMPVWDWPGWTPGPSENPLGESGTAGGGSETAPAPTPAPDQPPATVNQSPAAPLEPEEEEYPTAIEEDGSGPAVEYHPPSDQDDYEAMLEASEVANATLDEATPLPPDQGAPPGAGKYAVQVSQPTEAGEAQRQVNLLISQGFNAYYYENNGKFPVRVGHFPTRQAADEAKVKLEELGHKGPYVSALGN